MITALIVLALFFVGFKWVIPFIWARNAESNKTSIQKYGPAPYTPYVPKPNQPIPDNRPKPPQPPPKNEV